MKRGTIRNFVSTKEEEFFRRRYYNCRKKKGISADIKAFDDIGYCQMSFLFVIAWQNFENVLTRCQLWAIIQMLTQCQNRREVQNAKGV